MIKIEKAVEKRRFERSEYPRRFSGFASQGMLPEANRQFEGVVKNISSGGAALFTSERLENDQFVTLHIEGIGELPAKVRRVYDGGFAVEFAIDDKRRTRIQDELVKFRKFMKKQGGKA